METGQYIHPLTKIYSTFAAAKADDGKHEHSLFLRDEKPLSITDIALGTRNLIVGEPGIGKTELLKKIDEHHKTLGHETQFINLRSADPKEEIHRFVEKSSSSQKVLLLDALDEVRSTIFPELLKQLEKLSNDFPEVIIYVSSRWVFINHYSNQFPQYRFIRILPFTREQVVEYLVRLGNKEREVQDLLSRIMQFGHGKLIVQVPRYLFLLQEFIKGKTIRDIKEISRNELFEFFIYSKLQLEDERLNSGDKDVIKRVLEKLALTMEIYQSNEVSIDELMTFFDDVDSSLISTILSKVTLDVFLDKTVFQRSAKDLNKVGFENAEFQEYLAAKEITRFSEPQRAIFTFAVDQSLNEFLPSWFNTLTFIVDMDKEVLKRLIEFSGLKSAGPHVVDDGFLDFLGRINYHGISIELRRELFINILDYFEDKKQWLSGQLILVMPALFSNDMEDELKVRLQRAEGETGSDRYIHLGNITYIVALILEEKITLDKNYWRQKLLAYAADVNENGVLQRHALQALEMLRDETVLDELPDLSKTDDELINRQFLQTHFGLNADHPESVQYSIDAIKRNDFHGRYGLFEMKEKSSILQFLNALQNDEKFTEEFFDDSSLFDDKDGELIENIKSVFDKEVKKVINEVILELFRGRLSYSVRNSKFINGLIILLKDKGKNFLNKLIKDLNDTTKSPHALYFAQETFAQILEAKDVPTFIEAMSAAGDLRGTFNTMLRIKFSNREGAEKIFEAGRAKLPNEYSKWEKEQKNSVKNPFDKENRKRILKEFRIHLQPVPKQYNSSVFAYYNQHHNDLEPLTEKDRKHLERLVTDSVLKFNPSAHGLTANDYNSDGSIRSYTSSSISHYFDEALKTAQSLNIDITPYRTNIAQYIPFADTDDLRLMFELVKNFTHNELEPVVKIYSERSSDLWKHRPNTFIELVERYHLTDAVSILRDFVKEKSFTPYVRDRALSVVGSLSPDETFLKEIFVLYNASADSAEREIANTANGLLITAHANKEAIVWRIQEIENRIASFTRPSSRSKFAHTVGPLENELHFDRPFAKPLSELKHSGFENEYLEMLETALDVWSKGAEYHDYGQYMWETVFAYFENLKEQRVYEPLKKLQAKINAVSNQEGANWLANRAGRLRRSYLAQIGKPKNFSDAIMRYNEVRKLDAKNIGNVEDLFRYAQQVIEEDLKRWIEGEGAYDIIVAEKKFEGNANYEKLIQKTIKAQLENSFLKRGIAVDISREEQLLNEQRTDILIRHGFVGPLVLEIKLGSSKDLKKTVSGTKTSDSWKNMGVYMDGYRATRGIFLIIENTNKDIVGAKVAFNEIPNVWATSLSCFDLKLKKSTRKSKPTPKRRKSPNKGKATKRKKK